MSSQELASRPETRRRRPRIVTAPANDAAGDTLATEAVAVERHVTAVSVVGFLAPLHVGVAATLALRSREIAASLGTSTIAVGFALVVAAMAAGASATLFVRRYRTTPGILQAAVAVVALALLALVSSVPELLGVSLLTGVAGGALASRHVPFLWTQTPADQRLGVLATWVASIGVTLVAVGQGPALSAATGLTWRGVVLVQAAVGAMLVTLARRRWESLRGGAAESVLTDPSDELRRATSAPVTKRALVLAGTAGAAIVPVTHLAVDLMQWTWGQSGHSLASAVAAIWAMASIALVLLTHVIERQNEPATRYGTTVAGLAGAAALVAATSGSRLAALVALGIAIAAFLLLLVLAAAAAMQAVGPAGGWVPTLVFVTAVLAGGPLGLLLLGGIQRRSGIGPTVGSLAVVAVVASLQARRLHRESDALATVATLVPAAAPPTSSLLACQGVDVSYGQLQVLFDVDFSVDAGEMVALLGTNGAGKSTLLKAISGLILPQRGQLSFAGQDITYVSAEQRVALGISQIPGGKAVFPPMSVVDNLRVFGYALGRDRAAVDRGIEKTFETFPRLAERRNQSAGVLSGGEQQMLALGKALLLEPRLLLIDELSLGLAPVIVAELLEMVREINATGTAVVLVEQSVNIALSLVDHAYFMERGRIRFDGPAKELLERPDLLRSVFLQGTAAATGGERAR